VMNDFLNQGGSSDSRATRCKEVTAACSGQATCDLGDCVPRAMQVSFARKICPLSLGQEFITA
jgi:hypothetical protein